MGAARRREAPFPENAADTGKLSVSGRPQYVLRGLVEEDAAFILGRRRRAASLFAEIDGGEAMSVWRRKRSTVVISRSPAENRSSR